jgi:hypothetical protein
MVKICYNCLLDVHFAVNHFISCVLMCCLLLEIRGCCRSWFLLG